MTDGNWLQRDLGYLEAQVGTLVTDVAELKKGMHEIQQTLSEAKGGWRMLLLIGGAGGALGAVLAQLFPMFKA